MNKIMIIGSPGSGKSTLSKELEGILHYPVFHFDWVYHIDNDTQISKSELVRQLVAFMKQYDRFILDGNYTSTIPVRLPYCDTVILFDLPVNVCIENAIKRTKNDVSRSDMAPGFDQTKMDDDFLDFISNFKKDKLPLIKSYLSSFDGKIITLRSYKDKEDLLLSLKNR